MTHNRKGSERTFEAIEALETPLHHFIPPALLFIAAKQLTAEPHAHRRPRDGNMTSDGLRDGRKI